MNILLVHPGASWSTADVEAGLRYGLEHHGARVVQYRLDERIDRSRRWLMNAWRMSKRKNPTIEKPTITDIFYQAGIGTLERVFRPTDPIDVVVVVSAMFLHPDILKMLKAAGVHVLVLFTESPYDLVKELSIAGLVSGCWTNERTSVELFRQVNRQSGYVPHGWHPERHRPGVQPGDELMASHDVVFVGSAFHERIEWLNAIDWRGIDLGLYGSWGALSSHHRLRQYVKAGAVTNVAAAALYRRAKIGLNLYRRSMGFGRHAPQVSGAESLNPRAYELAACGVFALSDYRAESAELFGDLVPTFASAGEASDLMRDWLANPSGRAEIAHALPAVVAESSWVERATRVIGDVQQLLSTARAA